MAILDDDILSAEYEVAPTNDFSPIPAGEYSARVSSIELRNSKSGGQYLNLRFDITGPEYAGRVVFDMFNIRNANQTAEQIGRQKLGQLRLATGVTSNDTDAYLGYEVGVKLGIRKDSEYGDKNTVKSIHSLTGSQPPMPAPAAKPAAPARQASAAPPWGRK